MNNGPSFDPPSGKEKARLNINTFKNMVESANIVEVDEPTGTKQVDVAWEDENGFHREVGEARGVYVSESSGINVYTIDWTNDRSQTVVNGDQIIDLDEGAWQ